MRSVEQIQKYNEHVYNKLALTYLSVVEADKWPCQVTEPHICSIIKPKKMLQVARKIERMQREELFAFIQRVIEQDADYALEVRVDMH